MLFTGSLAPNFTLPDHANLPHKLYDFGNKYIVLYFYPKDNTPGCTTQAIEFSNHKKALEQNDAIVIGISKDSCGSHNKFISQHKLNLLLLSDVSTEVCQLYGVWKEKSMMGKKYMGIERTTFIINQQHQILHVWHKVQPSGHAEIVLKYITNTANESSSPQD